MINNFKLYAHIFGQMFKMDLIVFKKKVISGIFDLIIWISILLLIFTHVYPLLGMTRNFGEFWAVGAIGSCCVFEIWGYVANFISDKKGDRTIDYFLSLPIPSWLVFIRFVISSAFRTSVYSILIIPLSKLIIWDRMDLSNFMPIQFLVMFLTVNIFFGFFTLLMSTIPEDITQIRRVWVRLVFPMWFLSGVEFPWYTIHNKLSSKISYILLLNPMLYTMEGVRATVLGQQNYISFWICLIVLWSLIIIFGFTSIFILKKQLDCC
ncbi:hypothetical protein GF322_04190 [Candidatus Dependentiae bacterium]|nr:hypothetical protein [Candidatus Dependentiae bacterium]